MKYPYDFVIETQYGCYSDDGWCFVSSRENLADAISFCQRWGPEYRVVDSTGNVLYPPNNDVEEAEGGAEPES